MKLISSVRDMQSYAWKARTRGRSVGLVPTMGALHEGHLSLVRRARRENDELIVSIFVNPLQFGPQEDFKRYPRTLAQDLALLKKENVDVVFHPGARDMFPDGFGTSVQVPSLSEVLCGRSRPGHFQGVTTVVAKLLHVVGPNRAYFGQKDYQQSRIIARMVEDLAMPVRVVACPTVREKDGLALSSRNRYLSRKDREEAVKLYQALYLGRELVQQRVMRESSRLIQRLMPILSKIPRARVVYIAVVDPLTLAPMKTIHRPAVLAAALRIGGTRLIDNVVIS